MLSALRHVTVAGCQSNGPIATDAKKVYLRLKCESVASNQETKMRKNHTRPHKNDDSRR